MGALVRGALVRGAPAAGAVSTMLAIVFTLIGD